MQDNLELDGDEQYYLPLMVAAALGMWDICRAEGEVYILIPRAAKTINGR